VKKILILCAATFVVATIFVWRAIARPSRFGRFTNAPRAGLAELVEHPKEFLGKTVALDGTVTAQCKASGCFFSFRAGASSLRVDLQDLGGRIPYREGHRARVEGQLGPYGAEYELFASAVEFQ
jgi:hypothetical protein